MELTKGYCFVHNHIALKREHYYSFESYEALCGEKLRSVQKNSIYEELDGRKVCYHCLVKWKYLRDKEVLKTKG